MNKKSFLVSIALMAVLVSSALGQILEPVSWQYHPSRKQVQIGDTLELIFTATILTDWYLYSNDFDADLGPIPTAFVFENAGEGGEGSLEGSYELIGKARSIHAKIKYNPIWEGNISYFDDNAVFRQSIRVLKEDLKIKGSISYQVCSGINGKCISGNEDFAFDSIRISIPNADQGKTTDQQEKLFPKEEKPKFDDISVGNTLEKGNAKPADSSSQYLLPQNITRKSKKDGPAIEGQKADMPAEAAASMNMRSEQPELFKFAILAFLAGLAALLTPCVFPMVPMTVTFFTHQNNGNRKTFSKAFIYGLSIILIYTLAGTIVAWINGPAFANWLSTHWLPNLFFFAVFMLFALSFLGLFEITLPSNLVNLADRKSDQKGWAGIFFMAFTLVLVSFSCTGPIVGAILVASAGGEVLMPVIGMASFALALALPFSVFAAFPHWLKKLPKSGGWLNSVKVVLGFLELALGLKFLSVADQVYHWGILDREIYLALWIVIFSMLGLYLIGKIKLPHDDIKDFNRVGVPRLLLSICSFAFVVYLIPGMFGAPLKALAGYLPPMGTHDFNLLTSSVNSANKVTGAGLCEKPKYADKLHFPHGIRGYFDLKQALACAREQGKPLFIDFTGHGCVNCREMEAKVWSDPVVLEMLHEDFIVLALYVDEKEALPEMEWYRSSFDGKIKKAIGAQNADYQITKFNNNAQPFYVIMDPYTEQLLVEPKGYDLEVENFVKFLEEGKEEFENTENNYQE